MLVPDAGTVRVAGFDPISQPAQVRARTGWTPDVFGVYDTLTAREYVSFFAQAHRLPAATVADRVAELLELVHLEPYGDIRCCLSMPTGFATRSGMRHQ